MDPKQVKIDEEISKRPPHPSRFVRFLEESGTLADLDDQIKELTATVAEFGRPGELHIKVKMKSSGDGRLKAVLAPTIKLPQAEREERTFFTDEKGELTRGNPKQRNLLSMPKQESAG